MARISKERGDLKSAEIYYKELVDKWEGKPEPLAPSYVELARIYLEQGNYKEAELSVVKVLNMVEDTKLIPQDLHLAALELRGDIALKANKKDEAITAYETLLDKYELTVPLGSIRYKVGKLYFEQGKLSEAEKTWSTLAQKEENKVWSQMANEQLTHAKWQDEYKKYINRIPAMSDSKERK